MIQSPTFYVPDLVPGINVLDKEESTHCVRVLRKKKGDRIRVINGTGLEGEFEITDPNQKQCEISEIELISHPKPDRLISIAIAPTKQLERIEWFVEKSMEMGISTISFLECFNSERRNVNLERIAKKAITALKQSGNLFLPEINPLTPFSAFIKSNKHTGGYIAFLDSPPAKHLALQLKEEYKSLVLIGPEGDFSEEEVKLAKDNGFSTVSLGDSRLRTETAGVAACHILNLKDYF